MEKTKERIYVCHTFYNVYVTLLKEFNLPKEKQGQAEIALSTLSTDFTGLKEALEKSGVFKKVHTFVEKRDTEFPQLAKYKKSHNNVVWHMINRIIYTKKFPKLMEPYIDIDFREYRDIYVYCDWDPIGHYLSYKKIYYHALEDGLDCLKNLDGARYENRGHFEIKAWLAAKNIIFMQNGYGKYCLDMEINDRSCLKYDFHKYIEVPRKPLERNLTDEQKQIIVKIFIPDVDELMRELGDKADAGCMLYLTQPQPWDEEIRKKMCDDVIREYSDGCHVVIKPHPRETIDYAALRPDCTVIKGKFPIEVLNFLPGIHFKRAVSFVTTAMDTMDFVDEKINLGFSYWDRYEPKEKHTYNEII